MKKAKKSLSQNFLIDKNICKKIIKQTNLINKIVVEIGPGKGALTDYIINEKPKKIILIEKDNNLYRDLKEKYKSITNLKIYNDDILNFKFNNFNNLIFISNLPYNISTKVILYFFNYSKNIDQMIFMLQKEVAEKFDYNIKKMNKYKFFNKLICIYKRCFNISPVVFFPKPKVQSTLVKFKITKSIRDINKANNFSELIFKNKRKKINTKLKMDNEEITEILDKRVDQISIEELLFIYNFY